VGRFSEGTGVVEIVDTAEEAAVLALPPLLVRETVEAFLDEHELGSGPLQARQVGEGHSNVTYCIRRGDVQVVLRRPPRPPLPPSAHDVLREARVLRGLEASRVPVPRVLATCDDTSLLGVPFYVMEYLDGVTLTTTTPEPLASPECGAALAECMVSTTSPAGSVALARPPATSSARCGASPACGSSGARASCRRSTRSRSGCARTCPKAARRRSCTATTGSAT
jgi:hypothetical protein